LSPPSLCIVVFVNFFYAEVILDVQGTHKIT
jgi:hypothetical protein